MRPASGKGETMTGKLSKGEHKYALEARCAFLERTLDAMDAVMEEQRVTIRMMRGFQHNLIWISVSALALMTASLVYAVRHC
jgi:hypothetical protein